MTTPDSTTRDAFGRPIEASDVVVHLDYGGRPLHVSAVVNAATVTVRFHDDDYPVIATRTRVVTVRDAGGVRISTGDTVRQLADPVDAPTHVVAGVDYLAGVVSLAVDTPEGRTTRAALPALLRRVEAAVGEGDTVTDGVTLYVVISVGDAGTVQAAPVYGGGTVELSRAAVRRVDDSAALSGWVAPDGQPVISVPADLAADLDTILAAGDLGDEADVAAGGNVFPLRQRRPRRAG